MSGQLDGLSVLLVEDERLVRIAVTDMLESLGAIVEEAASVSEAREKLHNARFDIVITDLVMPGGGGDMLAQDIGLLWPNLPVLIITGSRTHEQEASGLPFLTKPFLTADLAAAIHTALAGCLSGGEDNQD